MVIGGDEHHLVDALGLELVLVFDVRHDVLLLARRGEGAGHGDDDDLLLLALCAPASSELCWACAGLCQVEGKAAYPCWRRT